MRALQPFSIVPFISAAGSVELIMIIVGVSSDSNDGKIDTVQALPLCQKERGGHPRLFAFNATASMNNKLWEATMQRFIAHWTVQHPGLHCVIMMDRLVSHTHNEFIAMMEKEGVHSLFFPAHTSHFMQPLDNRCFGAYKKILRKMKAEQIEAQFSVDTSYNPLLALSLEAEKMAFTADNIRAGFQVTGMWPVDVELMKTQA